MHDIIIKEDTCIEAWKNSLKHVVANGIKFKDRDNKECSEVLNMIIEIEHPEKDHDRIIDELKQFDWIYPTNEELSAIMFSKEELAIYEYSYGPRIFNFLGKKDQINDYVIPLLKQDPDTRRAVISLFNPYTDSDFNNTNVPSLMFIHFKIRNDKLNITCFIRSNDLFIGWPGNIYQLYSLQKYVADALNIKTGSLSTISCSAHVFSEQMEYIERII
jgi:thymidylate synthase